MDEADLKTKLSDLKEHRRRALELYQRLDSEGHLTSADRSIIEMFIKRIDLDIWNIEFLIKFETILLGEIS